MMEMTDDGNGVLVIDVCFLSSTRFFWLVVCYVDVLLGLKTEMVMLSFQHVVCLFIPQVCSINSMELIERYEKNSMCS